MTRNTAATRVERMMGTAWSRSAAAALLLPAVALGQEDRVRAGAANSPASDRTASQFSGITAPYSSDLPVPTAAMLPPGGVVASGGPVISVVGPRMSTRAFSFVHIDAAPPPPQIKVHDIITIEVDEKTEVIVTSRFNRQRNGAYTAQLKEFVRIVNGGKNLEGAASNEPSVEASLQNRLQTLGTATDQEGITYRIAATVVDVLPNGTVVLEARKSITSNQDKFEYRLSGRVDKGMIKPNRTAQSSDIAELKIERMQRGKVFDSTKANWGTRLLDAIVPF